MEQLQHRYEGGVSQLCDIFRDIGYDETERHTVLQDLTERVITVVDKVVEEQERTRQALEKKIEETHNAIHQVSAALGKNAPDLSVFDDAPLKVMLRNYDVQLGKLQHEKDAVMRELTADWTRLHALWAELGTPRNPQDYSSEINEFDQNGEFVSIDESKLGPNTVRRYKLQVQHWTAERDARARTIADLGALVAALETQLGEESVAAGDVAALGARAGGAASFARINSVKQRFETLSRVRDERAAHLATLRADLAALYELLQTPAPERINIAEGDLSRRTVEGCERERARVALLKGARMRELIESAVADLRAQYAALGLGEGRIGELCGGGKAHTEAMLTDVQREVATMRRVIASCQSITALIPRREELRALHAEVEARHQDPSRLLSKRGGRSLLEEQKMEARVKKELPSLERHMLALIAEWEAQYGREFVYSGRRYADVIVGDQQEDVRAVEDRKQRIAERKMRDLDSSTYVTAPAAAHNTTTAVASERGAAPATARPASKTQSRTGAAVRPPEGPQSARPASKTQSRTAAPVTPAGAARPEVYPPQTTPTNVPARKNPVSISRATGPAPRAPELTTPLAGGGGGGGKYSKVKSKVDTRRAAAPLSAIHNTPPRGTGGLAL